MAVTVSGVARRRNAGVSVNLKDDEETNRSRPAAMRTVTLTAPERVVRHQSES